MKNLVTVAEFYKSFDVKFNLFKDMLEKAEIDYIVINENMRNIDGVFAVTPSNISIEIKVYEENVKQSLEILNSIS